MQLFCVFVITVPEAADPVAIFAIKVVPSDAISSTTIQYTSVPVPAVLLANKLLTQSPGMIVTVSNGVAGVTYCTILVSPSPGSKLEVIIIV